MDEHRIDSVPEIPAVLAVSLSLNLRGLCWGPAPVPVYTENWGNIGYACLGDDGGVMFLRRDCCERLNLEVGDRMWVRCNLLTQSRDAIESLTLSCRSLEAEVGL